MCILPQEKQFKKKEDAYGLGMMIRRLMDNGKNHEE